MSAPTPEYLTRAQVEDYFGLGPTEVEQAFRELDVISLPGRRKVRVHRDDLRAWIERHRTRRGQVRAA